jgi:hypothetical protein
MRLHGCRRDQLSSSGVPEQDNQLIVSRDAVVASELRSVLDLNPDGT